MREDHEDLKDRWLLRNQQERDKGLTVEELNKRLEDKRKHNEWLATQSQATQLLLRTKDETDELIQERKKAHGDWRLQAEVAQKLKRAINMADAGLQPHQREALEMIAVKMSRIMTGDANYADHWDDICGYARLGKQGHE